MALLYTAEFSIEGRMANFFAGPRLSFDFPCRRQRKSRNLQHPGTMSICRLYADHTSDRRTQDEATEAWL